MLSRPGIEKAIKDNEIEISCYYVKAADGIVVNNKSILESSTEKNLYSDGLKLSMGPIIKLLNGKHVNKRITFKNKKNLVDLSKNNNRYVIEPGESIIILTNEYVKLNGKYACLIVPRISLSDVGIVITSAYVDPYYQGLLRLHLTNLSNEKFELHSLECVAQCFFFELSDVVSKAYKEKFSNKSVFFGQTWSEILESDRDPFPTKKTPSETEHFESLKHQFELIRQFLKDHSIIFLVLTNIIVIASGYALIKQDYQNTKSITQQVDSMLEPKASEVLIPPGELTASKQIALDIPKAEIVGIICNNDSIRYELVSGDTENITNIVFSYSIDSPREETIEVDFTYIVIRRLS